MHGLHVPRGLVYYVMTLDDNDRLLQRKRMDRQEEGAKLEHSLHWYEVNFLLVKNRKNVKLGGANMPPHFFATFCFSSVR